MKNPLFSRGRLSSLLHGVILCSMCAIPSTLRAQVHFSADERRIITITDERRDADSLLPYLASPTIKVAWRAAIGIGNIGDTSIRPALLTYFLSEQRDSVADAEAFALGLLGRDKNICQSLTDATMQHPTAERLKAIARTAIKADSASAAIIVGQLADQKKIDAFTEADAYMDFAIHHEVSSRMMNDLDALTGNNDPNVRWRAVYGFAIAGDSLDLSSRFPKLKDLLLDQGSPYVRMFSAVALGKLHDARADSALYRAFRGENDWRVRVNILRGFEQFKSFDSLILTTLQLADESGLRDSGLNIQVGLEAGSVMETFITSGSLSHADSSALRDWLDGFNGTDGRHDEIDPTVCARLTAPAVRLGTPTFHDAVRNYALFRDPTTRNYAVRAASTIPDSGFFISIIETMSRFDPIEQVVRLEVLDSLWGIAKRDPGYRKVLESDNMAKLFRGLLIHICNAVYDPAVDAVALGSLRDTSIIEDSEYHAEAIEQMAKYIPTFCTERFRDALLAAVEDASWLGDTSRELIPALRVAYDSANNWGDKEVMDSIASLLKNIDGTNIALPKPILRVSTIDWAAVENLPSKMIINFSTGSILLRILTDEAPLTALNMVTLAREQWFSGIMIHRVVPNFVIQAGDPSGTGWEGPGYTIRSEITPREYDREGLMGMASDGKDTESSQWFITHCPTPHLDARYTIWAEVTSGMDEVCKRKVGDKIDSFNAFQ